MAPARRTDPFRFIVGEPVRISDTIATRHAGSTGVIVGTHLSERSRTLDKYTVRLADGTEVMFWDIQLQKHSPGPESGL